jgi:nitrogen fixation/metabolism regulation signal transduction histidine kinase
MLIAGVLCVCAAVVMAVLGLRSLARPVGTGTSALIGALGTVAAGSYQTARYALRRDEAAATCSGSCATCTLACH